MLGQPVSMLIPAGGRLQADGQLPRRGHRHRPGADRHADAAQERRGRQVRRVLRRRPGRPAAGRPRHHRQHGPRVRGHLRHLPRRRRDAASTCGSPAGPRRMSQLVEAYCKEQGLFHTAATPEADLHRHAGRSTWAPSSRAWPGQAAAGSRAACSDVKKSFAEALPELAGARAKPKAGADRRAERQRHVQRSTCDGKSHAD